MRGYHKLVQRVGAMAALLSLILVSVSAGAQAVDANGAYAEPYLALDPGAHTAVINQADVDAAGRYVVTASDDKTVRIWSAVDGLLLRTIWLPAGPGNTGQAYAAAISPDGVLIAVGGFTAGRGHKENIYIFDRATGRMVRHIGGLPDVVDHIVFSRDGSRLAASLGSGGVRIYDPQSGAEIAQSADYAGSSYGVSFAPDGRVATTSYDGQIRLYAPDLTLIATLKAPSGKLPFGIAFSPDGSLLAVAYQDAVAIDVLDGRTLAARYSPDVAGATKGNLNKVAWSPDGRRLFAGGEADDQSNNNFLRVWEDAGRGSYRDTVVSDDTINSIVPLEGGRTLVATADPRLAMLDPSFHEAWAVGRSARDFRSSSLLLSGDGALVQLKSWYAAQSLRFDPTRRLLVSPPADEAGLSPPRIDGLPVTDWRDTEAPKLAGVPVTLKAYESSRALAVAPDGTSFLLATDWHLRRFGADGKEMWRTDSPSTSWAVNQSGDGRIAIAAFGDGTIRWYRLDTGAELLAFFAASDGQRWIAWTPQGFYETSPGGEELIRWVVNRGPEATPEVFPVGAYRDRFYRPDVVARVLRSLDGEEALRLADAARGVTTAPTTTSVVTREAPPVVTINDPAEGSYVGTPQIEVSFTVTGKPGEHIRRVRALVGNQEAAIATDLVLDKTGSAIRTFKVPITTDSPRLTLIAENAFGASLPAVVKLTGGIAQDSLDRPTLYVLAIGISDFSRAQSLHLDFAAADATEFVARMERQKGGLYRDVVVRPLINADANSRAIRDGFFWLKRKMLPHDVAAIFISTHGDNDGRGDLYLIASDTDVSDEIAVQQTGIEWSDLERQIEDLAGRGRALVFLDACHSGQVVRGSKGLPPDLGRAIAALRDSGNDITVFSSSSGAQLSREDPAYGHGIFTYALLEALDGKGFKSGAFVTPGDLNHYVTRRVHDISNGSQTPEVTTPKGATANPPIFMIP